MHQANWPAVFVEVFGSQRVEFAIGVMICCSATASIVSLPLAGALLIFIGPLLQRAPSHNAQVSFVKKVSQCYKCSVFTSLRTTNCFVCTSFTGSLWCLTH